MAAFEHWQSQFCLKITYLFFSYSQKPFRLSHIWFSLYRSKSTKNSRILQKASLPWGVKISVLKIYNKSIKPYMVERIFQDSEWGRLGCSCYFQKSVSDPEAWNGRQRYVEECYSHKIPKEFMRLALLHIRWPTPKSDPEMISTMYIFLPLPHFVLFKIFSADIVHRNWLYFF